MKLHNPFEVVSENNTFIGTITIIYSLVFIILFGIGAIIVLFGPIAIVWLASALSICRILYAVFRGK